MMGCCKLFGLRETFTRCYFYELRMLDTVTMATFSPPAGCSLPPNESNRKNNQVQTEREKVTYEKESAEENRVYRCVFVKKAA